MRRPLLDDALGARRMLCRDPFEAFEKIRQFTVAFIVERLDRYNLGLFGHAVLGSAAYAGHKGAVAVHIVAAVLAGVQHRWANAQPTLEVLVRKDARVEDVHCHALALR